MDQDIWFCELDGRRIAYATVGQGRRSSSARSGSPTSRRSGTIRAGEELLRGARPEPPRRPLRPARAVSPSGSSTARPPSRRRRRAPRRVDACSGVPATVFACSCASVVTASLAARSPERVEKIVFFGSYVPRDDPPEATRRSLVDFVRVNWALAAQMLAGLIVPRASGTRRRAEPLPAPLGRRRGRVGVPRARADGECAPFLAGVTMPTLVLHRRGDRTVPINRGRELASLLPNARFVALGGDSHLPHMDDQRELQRLPASSTTRSSSSRTATRHSAGARPRCCASSPWASRTERSRPRSS